MENYDSVRAQNYGWPPALVKATSDHFCYALGLRSGDIIEFTDAKVISNDWVHLETMAGSDFEAYLQFGQSRLSGQSVFGRGIDVRVSEIVWVADSPGKT